MSAEDKDLVFDGPSFIRLLDRQLGLYRRLHTLAEGQRKRVLEEDAEALLEVLASRQKVVSDLMRMNVQLGGLRTEWEVLKESMSAEERFRAEALLKDVREELAWLIAWDREDCETLSKRKASVGKWLASLQSASEAVSAYSPSGAGPGAGSRYMDQMDEEG